MNWLYGLDNKPIISSSSSFFSYPISFFPFPEPQVAAIASVHVHVLHGPNLNAHELKNSPAAHLSFFFFSEILFEHLLLFQFLCVEILYILNGHEFEPTPGDGEGQGSLASCSPWDHKESDTTE